QAGTPERSRRARMVVRRLTGSSPPEAVAREREGRPQRTSTPGGSLSEHPARTDHLLTRRALLRYGGSLGAAVASLSGGGAMWKAMAAAGAIVHQPDSLPDPRRPAGTPTDALPFDHLIV